MRQPDWQKLEPEPGVLREPCSDPHRLMVWLPEPSDDKVPCWERVSNLGDMEIIEERGICWAPATSIRAKPKIAKLFGGLVRRFRRAAEAQTWILPDGQPAEQVGTRRTDLILVWSEAGLPLAEAQIQERWLQAQRIKKIAGHLFVLAGIEAKPERPLLPSGNPRQQAEHLLGSARQAGDRRRLASALADRGVVLLRG